MPKYDHLAGLMRTVTDADPDVSFATHVLPYLIDTWLEDYARGAASDGVVETKSSGFSYLFDVGHERLIAAWGISRGRHDGARDKSRMAGHPLSAGQHYHRGHAIPHTLGGPTDINLVPQLGAVNVGPFRALEREAVATPGALYFTYWVYGRRDPRDQTPTGVEQGLLVPGTEPKIHRFTN
ncbi:MAG: DNA/RNA non-specific endonuclease [Gemmatimonadaceae bacterium]